MKKHQFHQKFLTSKTIIFLVRKNKFLYAGAYVIALLISLFSSTVTEKITVMQAFLGTAICFPLVCALVLYLYAVNKKNQQQALAAYKDNFIEIVKTIYIIKDSFSHISKKISEKLANLMHQPFPDVCIELGIAKELFTEEKIIISRVFLNIVKIYNKEIVDQLTVAQKAASSEVDKALSFVVTVLGNHTLIQDGRWFTLYHDSLVEIKNFSTLWQTEINTLISECEEIIAAIELLQPTTTEE